MNVHVFGKCACTVCVVVVEVCVYEGSILTWPAPIISCQHANANLVFFYFILSLSCFMDKNVHMYICL